MMAVNKVKRGSSVLERKKVVFSRLLWVSHHFPELEGWNVLDFSPEEIWVQFIITVWLSFLSYKLSVVRSFGLGSCCGGTWSEGGGNNWATASSSCLGYLIQLLIKSQKFHKDVCVYGSAEEMGIRLLNSFVLFLFFVAFCFWKSLAFFSLFCVCKSQDQFLQES